MDLDELKELMDEYIATLDDIKKDEAWCTQKAIAKSELYLFYEWLKNRKP